MADPVYKVVEVVGTSNEKHLEGHQSGNQHGGDKFCDTWAGSKSAKSAVASRMIKSGPTQVTVKVGFTLEED